MDNETPRVISSSPFRSGLAGVSIALATGLGLLADAREGGLLPVAALAGAVLVTAWQGGLRPGLAATALGAVAAAWFLPPYDSFAVQGLANQTGLALFVAVGAGIALLAEAFHTARVSADRQAASAAQRDALVRALLSGAREGIIVADDAGKKIVALNPVAESLTGWQSDAAAGRPLETVFQVVDEQTQETAGDHVAQALRDSAVGQTGAPLLLISREGAARPIEDCVVRVADEAGIAGGVVLTFRDVSDLRRAERELQESEERFRLMANTAPVMIWMSGLDKQCVFFNRPWLDFTGRAFKLEAGRGWMAGIHPDDRAARAAAYDSAYDSRRPFQMEYRLRRADGEYRWLLDSAVPRFSYDGTFSGFIGSCIDVTDRKRLEEQLIRDIADRKRAAQANRFLADVGAALGALVDDQSTLQKVASLAVPFFADWCTIDILEADGSLRRLAVNHADPRFAPLATESRSDGASGLFAPSDALNVLRTGDSELIRDFSDEVLREFVDDDRQRAALRELEVRSLIAVPLIVRGQATGVITFVTAGPDRRYGDDDLALAEELAHRAAIAVDNAHLYQALRDSDRRKDEFLAMLAHELRNPLAPIRNALTILEQPDADEAARRQAVEMAGRQVAHVTRLVDDLLDVSRIMLGKIALRKERVDLATIVSRAVETAQPAIRAEGHRLTVSLPQQPIVMNVDAVRLSQVVSNLLHNAAKYTPRGGLIELTAERAGDDVTLCVRDNGIGIAPEMLTRVFDLFMQAAPGDARSQSGLGIGLTLVRTLVALHHGTIEAHSAGPGRGTEFLVRLPDSSSEASFRPAGSPAAAESFRYRGPPRRILIVDDNEDAGDSLALLFRVLGQDVRVARNGRDGLDAVRAELPEIVLLDIGLPDMTGYQVAHRVREVPGGEQLILVALTGWGQEHDRNRSRDAGFDHHLTKPVEPAALRSILQMHKPAVA